MIVDGLLKTPTLKISSIRYSCTFLQVFYYFAMLLFYEIITSPMILFINIGCLNLNSQIGILCVHPKLGCNSEPYWNIPCSNDIYDKKLYIYIIWQICTWNWNFVFGDRLALGKKIFKMIVKHIFLINRLGFSFKGLN